MIIKKTIDPLRQDATSFSDKFIFIGFNSEEDKEFLSLKAPLIEFLSEIHKNYTLKRVKIEQLDIENFIGDYVSRTIRLGKYSKTKILDLIHEYAHFVEHNEGRYIESIRIAILELTNLLLDSCYVKGLKKEIRNSETFTDNQKSKIQEYIFRESELFARAYEQYILLKIKMFVPKRDNKKFKSLLIKLDSQMNIRHDSMGFQYYWSEPEFIKIQNAFDKLFN